jgi:hypothetical protein
MRAKYCPCKNTYTINNCDCEKKGGMYYSALPHGIGSLVGQGNSIINGVVSNPVYDDGNTGNGGNSGGDNGGDNGGNNGGDNVVDVNSVPISNSVSTSNPDEGYTALVLVDDEIVTDDFSVVYDRNNDGRGEMYNAGNFVYHQSVEQKVGDFKVRSSEYGTFNETPSNLEATVVYRYSFNGNTGNTYGYHPSSQSTDINPGLVDTLSRDFGGSIGVRKYSHFNECRDESFNKVVQTLQLREENSLSNSAFETTVYKESSITDWSVGMSVYSDSNGTSVTESYVDSYATGNDLDRYHFISKNSSSVWVLVRCTDGIVTHIEAVNDTNYIRFSQFYNVTISNQPSEQAPGGRLATTKAWVESKLSDENAVFEDSDSLEFTTVKFSIDTNAFRRPLKRLVLDLSEDNLGEVGTRLYRSTYPTNAGIVFHKQLAYEDANTDLLTESDEARYSFKLLANGKDGFNNLEFNEQPLLILEIDNATGLVSDRAWINTN